MWEYDCSCSHPFRLCSFTIPVFSPSSRAVFTSGSGRRELAQVGAVPLLFVALSPLHRRISWLCLVPSAGAACSLPPQRGGDETEERSPQYRRDAFWARAWTRERVRNSSPCVVARDFAGDRNLPTRTHPSDLANSPHKRTVKCLRLGGIWKAPGSDRTCLATRRRRSCRTIKKPQHNYYVWYANFVVFAHF